MSKLLKTVAGVVAALALVAGGSSASALTASEAQVLISVLGLSGSQADAVMALVSGGSSASSSSCASYTRDLTLGSTGSDVTSLQQMLVSGGYLVMPAGVSMGYFGGLTQAALAKYQAAMGISPAAGYFGPVTRGSITCTSTGSTGSTGSTNTSSSLNGAAGSISDATFLSAYNNEEVGEEEEDVEVVGVEIEADQGSDINIIAVTLDFDQSTGATEDFEDYADEVSVWFEGEEVARIDADEFDDDNNYRKTVSLDEDAIIKADKTGDLVVAVSGVKNLDSNDAGDTWKVEVEAVRFEDAQGAIITESAQGDIGGATRSFTFETFATASDTEFRILGGDNSINDAQVVDVDDNDDTDNVAVFSFKVKVSGDDVELKDLVIGSTLTGTANTLDDIFSQLVLEIDGDEVASKNPTASTSVVFDDIDMDLEVGTYDFTLVGDIKATSTGAYIEGDTFLFTIGEAQTDRSDFDVEDKNGDNLLDADKIGSESSEAHALYADGISAEFVSADGSESYSVDSTDNDRAELVIEFDVTNFGEDTLYIPNVLTYKGASTTEVRTAPSTSQGIGYTIQFSGTTALHASNVSGIITNSTADLGTNAYEIGSGDTETFTIKVTVRNTSTQTIDNTQVKALLSGIGWATTDSATSASVYTTDLDDIESTFETVAD